MISSRQGRIPKSRVHYSAYEVVNVQVLSYNNRYGRSSDFRLFYEGDSVSCITGNNKFIFPKEDSDKSVFMIPVMILGSPIIGFTSESGNLLLNLTLFDSSNNVVLKIVNNHLFYSINPWDIEFVGRTLTIREKPRKFLVKITFNPPETIVIEEGRIRHKNIEALINQKQLTVLKSGNVRAELRGNTCTARGNLAVGVLIGELPRKLKDIGAVVCFNLPG